MRNATRAALRRNLTGRLTRRAEIAPQRVQTNEYPNHVQRHRRPSVVPGAVDDESGGANNVHRLVNVRTCPDPAERQQTVSAQNEQRGSPPGYVDKCLECHDVYAVAAASGNRRLSSLRTSQKLKIACKVTLPIDTYHSCTSCKCGIDASHSDGTTKVTTRLAELNTAGMVLPSP
jgi:hypothetical protein